MHWRRTWDGHFPNSIRLMLDNIINRGWREKNTLGKISKCLFRNLALFFSSPSIIVKPDNQIFAGKSTKSIQRLTAPKKCCLFDRKYPQIISPSPKDLIQKVFIWRPYSVLSSYYLPFLMTSVVMKPAERNAHKLEFVVDYHFDNWSCNAIYNYGNWYWYR